MTEIRPYRESDQSGVIALWSVVFPDDPPWNAPGRVIANKLNVQRELFLVCERAGYVVEERISMGKRLERSVSG